MSPHVIRIRIAADAEKIYGWAWHSGELFCASIKVPPLVPATKAEHARDLTASVDAIGRAITESIAGVTGVTPTYLPAEGVKS